MAGLDDIIHQPLRLRIMAALNALPRASGLEFAKLKKLTGATDGNLGAHIETLAKAGYVAVEKAFVGKKPQTTVTATAAGRAPSPAMSQRCRKSSRRQGAKRSETPLHKRDAPLAAGGSFVRPTWPLNSRIWLIFMNILLLGSGGREHALAWKIAASPLLTKLWCAPGNAGIAREAECVALDIADHPAVIDFCKNNAVDLVVVGPETPLAAGIVDDLAPPASRRSDRARRRRSSKAPRASPRRSAPNSTFRPARMAASPTLTMRWPMSASRARRSWSRPTGLAAGKGVVVAKTLAEAEAAIAMMFDGALRRGRRRGRDRGISRRPRDQLLCAVRRRHRDCRWRPRRTTSGCSITTRDRTPAAWAPIRRRRS